MILKEDIGDHVIYSDGKIWSKFKNNWMNPSKHKKGYLSVSIKGKRYGVHQLVAKYFLKNPLNLSQLDHKNSRKDDNRIENLEWVTQSTNILRSYKSGNHPLKLKDEQILEIRQYFQNNPKAKQAEIACLWNTDQPTISRILSYRRRKGV
jgi:hypothetical protein